MDQAQLNLEDEDLDDGIIQKFKIEDSDISNDNNDPWTDYEDETIDWLKRRAYGVPLESMQNPESLSPKNLIRAATIDESTKARVNPPPKRRYTKKKKPKQKRQKNSNHPKKIYQKQKILKMKKKPQSKVNAVDCKENLFG